MLPMPTTITITDDLRILGAGAGCLRPSQGLALAEDLLRKSMRRALSEEAGLDYFLGLPTGQAAGAGQFLWDVMRGEEEPHGLGEWVRGIMYGPPPKNAGR